MTRRHHVAIAATEIEFVNGGNTIWVHTPTGTTALRIKCTGRVIVDSCDAPVAHADVMVDGDIRFCLPKAIASPLPTPDGPPRVVTPRYGACIEADCPNNAISRQGLCKRHRHDEIRSTLPGAELLRAKTALKVKR